MKIRISNSEIQKLLSDSINTYPKYVTQLIIQANQNSQGTRPKTVGKMTDLIQNFDGKTMEDWKEWYLERHPKAIEEATDKVFRMIENFKEAIEKIDRETIKKWIEEFVFVKTYAGLKFQEAILIKLSKQFNTPYQPATSEEESKGIDGYIGKVPVSIKPSSYTSKRGLNEIISVPIIFYEKTKKEIIVEFDEALLEQMLNEP